MRDLIVLAGAILAHGACMLVSIKGKITTKQQIIGHIGIILLQNIIYHRV